MTTYRDESYAIHPKSGSGRSFDKNEGVDSEGGFFRCGDSRNGDKGR